MAQIIQPTLKGKALLIAIDTGLVKRGASGRCNIAPFLRFWERFSELPGTDGGGSTMKDTNTVTVDVSCPGIDDAVRKATDLKEKIMEARTLAVELASILSELEIKV